MYCRVTGDGNIVDKWRQHFNSSKDVSQKEYVLEQINDVKKLCFNRFTPSEVADAIKMVKNGKSAGMDVLYGEHFKLAHCKINVFNCMIIYEYMPLDIMNTLLLPLIKVKKGKLCNSNNYRILAINCIASKILS